jgi:macrolide transport system ATP-binding/permease protein
MRGLWFPRRRAKDISEEIETHLAMATRDYIARGMSPDEARSAALREFGNVPLIQQTTREVWAWTRAEQLLQDLRIGARILSQAPGLSATVIVLIALVVGGNTTIYAMVNSLLVSPAPGVAGDGIVVIQHVDPDVIISDPFLSFPNFEDYARAATTVTHFAAWSPERLTLGSNDGNYALFGALATANYFDTFGVTIVRGRGLRAEDDEAGDGLVAVINHRVWQEQFRAAEDIVGGNITINRTPATIVGVAAEGFAGAVLTPGEDVWLPIRAYYRAIGSEDALANRAQPLVLMAGRLTASASLADARAEFATLSAQMQRAFPDAFSTYSTRGVVPLKAPRAVVSRYSATALLPMADMAPLFLAVFSIVTLLTLMVVCANVANLMLGRAVERQRDTAVRQALGASRQRIVRLLVAEGATLALTAWVAACLFAWWTSRALLRLVEPRPGLLAEARPDWTLAAYGMTLALLATIAFSLAPAVRSWRVPVLPLLKAGEQSVAHGGSRLTSALVVLQFALSVLLVTSAGLAYRTMSTRNSGGVGFDSSNLLLVTVRLGPSLAFISNEPTAQEREAAFASLERVRERLGTTTGVVAASYVRRIPRATFMSVTPVRRESEARAAPVFVRPVGPDYLRVLGLAALNGRELTAADGRGVPRAAVINRRLAADLFADDSPIGQPLLVGERRERVQIVGVAPDALYDGPGYDPQPRYMFVAEQQMPGNPPLDPSFVIRHRGTVEAVTPLVSRAIGDVDPGLPIVSMATMNARLASVTELETIIMQLLVGFAVLSLIVAALGQYAVAMFNTRRRTRDFGVRLALGASARQVQVVVVREAFALALPGLVLGFALSAAVATTLRAMLFGVTPVDPPTYAAVFLLLVAVSVAASYLPAWRAGRVNVVDALRSE